MGRVSGGLVVMVTGGCTCRHRVVRSGRLEWKAHRDSHLGTIDEVKDFLHEVIQENCFTQAEAEISGGRGWGRGKGKERKDKKGAKNV